MTKIINFKSKKEKQEEWVQDVINASKNAKSMAVLIDNGEEVITAYYKCDCIQKMNLKSHLEYDISHTLVKNVINDILEL